MEQNHQQREMQQLIEKTFFKRQPGTPQGNELCKKGSTMFEEDEDLARKMNYWKILLQNSSYSE